MIISKWLVDEELSKNSSLHFELISTIVASRDCEISLKMLIEIEILAFRNCFMEHWIYDQKNYLNLRYLQFQSSS